MKCLWFAMCKNDTDLTYDHPVLGWTPACKRCLERVGLTTLDQEHIKTIDQHLTKVSEWVYEATEENPNIPPDEAASAMLEAYLTSEIGELSPGNQAVSQELRRRASL